MKKVLYLVVISVFLIGCETNEDPVAEEREPAPVPVEETETGTEDNEVDFENISAFSVSITSPMKERDFTYHNEGKLGVFEDPETQTLFEGRIQLEYEDSNSPIPSSRIDVKWTSDLDGILYQGELNEQYESIFETSLSLGNHKIFIEASIGSDPNFIVRDSIVISNVISLHLEPTDRSLKLNWSKYMGNDFQSYLIYREDYEPIAEITDINKLNYEDTTLTLAETKRFQIVIKTTENEQTISGSNLREAEAGKYIKIDHFITKAINDKFRNRFYAIVGEKYSSSRYASEYGLIILNNDSEIVEIDSHILKENRFADLDMSPDGKYLFLVQRGVDKVTRLDLETWEVVRFDVAYGGWGVHKIEVGNNYMLYCHRTPPTSGDSHFYLLNGLTGERLNSNGSLVHGDMEFNVYNDKLYHGTTVREKYVGRYSLNSPYYNLIMEETFSPDIGWPKAFILLSEDGENIFWEQFQLDKDLNLVRVLESPIIACNLDSSLISDGGKLMNFQNLNTLFVYPGFPYYDQSEEVFTNDNSLLFIKSGQPYTNERYTYLFKIKINN